MKKEETPRGRRHPTPNEDEVDAEEETNFVEEEDVEDNKDNEGGDEEGT